MKLAIVSDIHANLAALEAVLEDIEGEKVDKIYCLGDVIGYGPDPRECLELALDFPINLLGNHEEAIKVNTKLSNSNDIDISEFAQWNLVHSYLLTDQDDAAKKVLAEIKANPNHAFYEPAKSLSKKLSGFMHWLASF